MRNPCDNCIDPAYCHMINSCHADMLLIERGPMLNDDDGWELNDELSELVEEPKPKKNNGTTADK